MHTSQTAGRTDLVGKALRRGLAANSSPIAQLSSSMHLLLTATGCRCEWGSENVMC